MAQLAKCQILDFSSGHDLRVVRWGPASGSWLGMEPASLFPYLSAPTPLHLFKRERERERENENELDMNREITMGFNYMEVIVICY